MTDRMPLDQHTDDTLTELYERLEQAEATLAEFTAARQHGAFTFCPQQVGHVTAAAFAKKISEKREALGQREEAVQYANQQKQRAARAEAERDQHAAQLRAFVELADVTHRYRSHGGHDSLGEDLSCAGCALRDRARTALNTAQADTEGNPPCTP